MRRTGSASRRVAARSGLFWDPGLPRPGAIAIVQTGQVPGEISGQEPVDLQPTGVLVVPVNGILLEVRPGPEVVEHGRYAFVPLVGG